MARIKVKSANWFIRKFIMMKGSIGWTSIWNTIYIVKGHEHKKWLITHEMVHIDQIERDGRLWMPIKYLYYNIKYGYRKNPYEVEAYKISDRVKQEERLKRWRG